MKHRHLPFQLLILCALIARLSPLSAQSSKAIQRFEQTVEKALEDFHAVGLAVAVVKDGKQVYAKGFGYRDQEQQLPVTPNTLFAIGSTSKAFTATTVCQLAEEGKLDLDEPLITYLPDFQLHDEYATEKMTPRDLLCHRSGLPRHDLVWYMSEKNRKELYQSLVHLEPTTSFRGTWQYQNLMFMTAGYLVEAVSGQTWEDFTQAHIFDPLDMKSANFSVEDMQKQADYSLPYAYNLVEKKIEQMDFRNIDAIGPAGSINASVNEMSNWVIMQLGEGKYQETEVLGKSYLQQTHTPQMVMPGNVNDELFYRSYGLGWMITAYRNHLRVYHGGNIDGFSANVSLFPKDELGIVVLVNQNGSVLTGMVRNLAADLWLELEEIDWSERMLKLVGNQENAPEVDPSEKKDPNQHSDTQPSHDLQAYTGIYSHPAYGEIEFLLEKDTLALKMEGESVPLSHYHYDIFEMETPIGNMKVHFKYDERGDVTQVTLPLEPTVDAIEFTKQIEANLDDNALEKYTGEYELMGQIGKVYVTDSSLRLLVSGQPEYTLEPLGEHRFSIKGANGFTMTFTFESGEEKADSLVSSQPNGTFTMKRKE